MRDEILVLSCPACGANVAVIYIAPTPGDLLDPPRPARWDFLVPPSVCTDCRVSDDVMLAAIEAELRPPSAHQPLADLPR